MHVTTVTIALPVIDFWFALDDSNADHEFYIYNVGEPI